VRAAGEGKGFGGERVVVELVEVAFVGEPIGGPDATETFDKFSAAPVAFGVFEPPLSDAGEFGFEPAGYDIDGDTAWKGL